MSLACAVWGCGFAAPAAQYQVGPARADKDLADIADQLKPGDVVTLDGGATYQGGITLGEDGAPGAGVIRIIGKRVNGKRPVLKGAREKGGAVLRVAGSHYDIEGLDMTAGNDGLAWRCFYSIGDDVTLRDSIVHDSQMTGISGADGSGSLTLEGVEVCRCGKGLYAHQIYVGSSLSKYPDAVFRMRYCYVHDGTGGNNVKSRVTRSVIEYNWIEGASFHELDLVGPDPKDQPVVPPGTHCDSDIIGNVLVKRTGSFGSIARLGSDGTGASRGLVRMVNNTIVLRGPGPAHGGVLWIKGEVAMLMAWNNVFWSDAGPMKLVGLSGWAGNTAFVGGGNWWPVSATGVPQGWTGIAGLDPGFRGLEDYRPRSGSPLVGAGALPPPDTIPRGVPPLRQLGAREQARTPGRERDIGAYPLSLAQPGVQ